MTSTIEFPTSSDFRNSTASIVSRFSVSQQTARSKTLELMSLCYGSRDDFESDSKSRDLWIKSIERLYDPNAGDYENPWLTAAQRGTILDIQILIRELSVLDCPYPRLFTSLLFRRNTEPKQRPLLFKALRIWTEVLEIYDNESFDGSQNSVVEHIVHLLFLPSLHDSDRDRQVGRSLSNDSLLYSHTVSVPFSTSSVYLNWPFGGAITRGWSPFHFRMKVTTCLSFNDAGRVVHHRDLIDLKDLIQGFPGGTAFQWLTSTFAAKSLSLLSRLFVYHPKEDDQVTSTKAPTLKYPIRSIYPASRSARAPDT